MMPEAMKILLRDSLPGPAWERSLSEEGGKRYLELRRDDEPALRVAGIRMRADGISRYGRATQGVKVMNMREGDVVSAIARMVVSESGATDEEIDAD